MILLDTEVVIDLLRKMRYEAGSILFITLIEVLRGIEPKRESRVKELLEESFEVLTIDNEVIKIYCKMYRKLKEDGLTVPDADLLIAATAISHSLPLKTRDEHFKRLEEFGLTLTD